jgi:hypothetical protein
VRSGHVCDWRGRAHGWRPDPGTGRARPAGLGTYMRWTVPGSAPFTARVDRRLSAVVAWAAFDTITADAARDLIAAERALPLGTHVEYRLAWDDAGLEAHSQTWCSTSRRSTPRSPLRPWEPGRRPSPGKCGRSTHCCPCVCAGSSSRWVPRWCWQAAPGGGGDIHVQRHDRLALHDLCLRTGGGRRHSTGHFRFRFGHDDRTLLTTPHSRARLSSRR